MVTIFKRYINSILLNCASKPLAFKLLTYNLDDEMRLQFAGVLVAEVDGERRLRGSQIGVDSIVD